MKTGATIGGHGWIAFVIAAGVLAAAITAVLTCAAVAWRSPLGRPLRWAWQRLVGEPVKEFFTDTVGDIVEAHTAPLRRELSPNGGSSLVDKVDQMVATQADMRAGQDDRDVKLDALAVKISELHAYTHEGIHAIRGGLQKLTGTESTTERVVDRLGEIAAQLSDLPGRDKT